MPSTPPDNNNKGDDGPNYKQQAKTMLVIDAAPNTPPPPRSDISSSGDQEQQQQQQQENYHRPRPQWEDDDGPDYKQQAKSVVVAGLPTPSPTVSLSTQSSSNPLRRLDAPGSKLEAYGLGYKDQAQSVAAVQEVRQVEPAAPEEIFDNNHHFENEADPNNPVLEEGENVPIVVARLVGIEELGDETRAQVMQPQAREPEGLRINEVSTPQSQLHDNNQQEPPITPSTTTHIAQQSESPQDPISPPDNFGPGISKDHKNSYTDVGMTPPPPTETVATDKNPSAVVAEENKSMFFITRKRFIWIIVALVFIIIVAAIVGICAGGSCGSSSSSEVVSASANANKDFGSDNYNGSDNDTTTVATTSPTTRSSTTGLRRTDPPTNNAADGVFHYDECLNECYDDFYDETDTDNYDLCHDECYDVYHDNTFGNTTSPVSDTLKTPSPITVKTTIAPTKVGLTSNPTLTPTIATDSKATSSPTLKVISSQDPTTIQPTVTPTVVPSRTNARTTSSPTRKPQTASPVRQTTPSPTLKVEIVTPTVVPSRINARATSSPTTKLKTTSPVRQTTPSPTIKVNDVLKSCVSHSDCNAGICGRKTHSQTADYVCCKDGYAHYLEDLWGYGKDDWICSEMNTGDQCAQDYQCSSRICISGICIAEHVEDLGACDSSSDCISGSCGRSYYSQSAPYICCKDGDMGFFEDVWGYSKNDYICNHINSGEQCTIDNQCESGTCVSGICASNRAADLGTCDSDVDCVSGRCGRKDHRSTAPYICCKDGYAHFFEDVWGYSKNDWICSEMDTGDQCAQDYQCSSRICISGLCVAEHVEDLGACDSNSDCINGSCGRSYYSQSAPYICCKDGDMGFFEDVWGYSKSDYICNHVNIGEQCQRDSQCDSGICLSGICTENRVADLETCDSNADCESGTCGLSENRQGAPMLCCSDGAALLTDVDWDYWNDYYVCSNQGEPVTFPLSQDGESCNSATDCDNLSACASSAYTDSSSLICCSEGESYTLAVSWDYNNHVFCGNLPIGTICGHDRMCASGLCIKGVCATERLSDGDNCDEANNCQNQVACAKSAFTESAGMICCAKGKYISLGVTWDYIKHDFCGDLPVGNICGDDRMCASGFCVKGRCSSERLLDGDECEQDNQCASRKCAKSSYMQLAPSICCTDGESYILAVPWDYYNYDFCGNLPSGTICGNDRMCASGLCIDGVCATQRLPDGESCQDANNCQNQIACAKNAFTESADSICCTGGKIISLSVSWDFYPQFFCGELPIGTICGDNRMCDSGNCVENKCVA